MKVEVTVSGFDLAIRCVRSLHPPASKSLFECSPFEILLVREASPRSGSCVDCRRGTRLWMMLRIPADLGICGLHLRRALVHLPNLNPAILG